MHRSSNGFVMGHGATGLLMDLLSDIEPLVFLWIWYGTLRHWSSYGFGMGHWATGLLMDLVWDIELLVFLWI